MQQNGSTAQTVSQHAPSEQPRVWLGAQQSFAFGAPQMSSHVVHSCSACAAHVWLHASMQQNGSTAQTASQQTSSEQPGNTLVEQQSLGLVSPQPPPPQPMQIWQNLMAFWAQLASHAVSQQEKSKVQMVSQHSASLQPGVVLGAQQSFPFGWPQTTPLQADGSQFWLASWAQTESHRVTQQDGSVKQIVSQQVASEQPGVMPAEQQSFAFGAPQFVKPGHELHRTLALAAQSESQPESQQQGSSVQTVVQQAASEQPGNWLE
jgi:hypothetical protein